MQVLVHDLIHNRQWIAYDRTAGFSVGSAGHNQVALLGSRLVAPVHFTVDYAATGWQLTVNKDAVSLQVDGLLVAAGETAKLNPPSDIELPGFLLVLRAVDGEMRRQQKSRASEVYALQREIHQKVIDRMELRREQKSRQLVADSAMIFKISANVDEIIKTDYQRELGAEGTLRPAMLTLAMVSRLQRRSLLQDNPLFTVRDENLPGYNLAFERLLAEYKTQLIEQNYGDESGTTTIVRRVRNDSQNFAEVIAKIPENLQFYLIGGYFKKFVYDSIFGLGPLQQLLDIPDISEIMVVSPSLVYIEQNGRLKKSPCQFLDDQELMAILERIVAPLGRRIDRSSPLVDARLPDGSRVNAVIPPLALKGPSLTIRRFPAESITVDHLLEWNSLNEAAVELLRGLVLARKNIIVAGGTGSGKTTMLNVIASFIGEHERLVTIEDSAELRLPHEHLVALETRPANVEGAGAITIRDLVKNALRMRPDRIIVGECRGAEALDMLQAMNTGHNGSMTTIHANNPLDLISRLETMVLMAVEIPLAAVRRQIAQALDFVVYLERLPNGQRMVTAIAEVGDMDMSTGEVTVRMLMAARYDEAIAQYRLMNSGYIPQILPELAARKLVDLKKIFGVEI